MWIEVFPIVDGKPQLPKRLFVFLTTRPDDPPKDDDTLQAEERNLKWLQGHWEQHLLPWPDNQHIAILAQQVFVAATREEAMTLAHRAHPAEKGMLTFQAQPRPHINYYLESTPLARSEERRVGKECRSTRS